MLDRMAATLSSSPDDIANCLWVSYLFGVGKPRNSLDTRGAMCQPRGPFGDGALIELGGTDVECYPISDSLADAMCLSVVTHHRLPNIIPMNIIPMDVIPMNIIPMLQAPSVSRAILQGAPHRTRTVGCFGTLWA